MTTPKKPDARDLKNFQAEFNFDTPTPQVGEEYKVTDLEFDPFIKNFPEVYRNEEVRRYGLTARRKILLMRDRVSEYFTGEFAELNNDEFNEVWEKFFFNWFWSDVYATYSPELLNIEIESWKNRPDINKFDCCYKNPWRLFRLVERHTQTAGVFESVFTGIRYHIDENEFPLIWASCAKGKTWIEWMDLIREFVSAEQSFISTQRLTAKRVMRIRWNTEKAKNENRDLDNTVPVFDIIPANNGAQNTYREFNICPPEIPRGIWDNLLNWFTTRAGWLGYMQNMNDKRERLTVAENFKDTHACSNIQQLFLNRLNRFAYNVGELLGIKLNFGLSNWCMAEGIPDIGRDFPNSSNELGQQPPKINSNDKDKGKD